MHPSTITHRRRHPGCRAAGCPARSPSGSPGPTTAGRCDTPLDCIPAAPGHAGPQWAKTTPTTVCWGLSDPPRAPPDARKALSRASRPRFGRRKVRTHPQEAHSIAPQSAAQIADEAEVSPQQLRHRTNIGSAPHRKGSFCPSSKRHMEHLPLGTSAHAPVSAPR